MRTSFNTPLPRSRADHSTWDPDLIGVLENPVDSSLFRRSAGPECINTMKHWGMRHIRRGAHFAHCSGGGDLAKRGVPPFQLGRDHTPMPRRPCGPRLWSGTQAPHLGDRKEEHEQRSPLDLHAAVETHNPCIPLLLHPCGRKPDFAHFASGQMCSAHWIGGRVHAPRSAAHGPIRDRRGHRTHGGDGH